jgi:hypothetical protein
MSDGIDADMRKKGKKEKSKESRFPTLGDMFSEYKNMGNSWYTAQYARAAEEQRVENTALSSPSYRNGSTDVKSPVWNKTMKLATPRPSEETAVSSESSGSRVSKDKRKKKKGSSSFMSMKELWSEYKSNANSWYTAPYKEENVRNIATPQPHI